MKHLIVAENALALNPASYRRLILQDQEGRESLALRAPNVLKGRMSQEAVPMALEICHSAQGGGVVYTILVDSEEAAREYDTDEYRAEGIEALVEIASDGSFCHDFGTEALDYLAVDGDWSEISQLPEGAYSAYPLLTLPQVGAKINLSDTGVYSPASMESIFAGWPAEILSALDFSRFDTSRVENMSDAFDGASVAALDLSGWDTSSVTDMGWMFKDCAALALLRAKGWNTSSVTDMRNMFGGCSSLASLDLSDWSVSSVGDMSNMFNGCSSLRALSLGEWDFSSVADMTDMFGGCSALTTVTGALSGISVDLDLSACPLTYESALAFINGLAQTESSKTLKVNGSTYSKILSIPDYSAKIAGKNWRIAII